MLSSRRRISFPQLVSFSVLALLGVGFVISFQSRRNEKFFRNVSNVKEVDFGIIFLSPNAIESAQLNNQCFTMFKSVNLKEYFSRYLFKRIGTKTNMCRSGTVNKSTIRLLEGNYADIVTDEKHESNERNLELNTKTHFRISKAFLSVCVCGGRGWGYKKQSNNGYSVELINCSLQTNNLW